MLERMPVDRVSMLSSVSEFPLKYKLFKRENWALEMDAIPFFVIELTLKFKLSIYLNFGICVILANSSSFKPWLYRLSNIYLFEAHWLIYFLIFLFNLIPTFLWIVLLVLAWIPTTIIPSVGSIFMMGLPLFPLEVGTWLSIIKSLKSKH